jgi:hypothetical protein
MPLLYASNEVLNGFRYCMLPLILTPSSFCSQVEEIIHPKFLEALLSPDPELDLMALTEFLEQEEGLTPVQLSMGWRVTK